MNALHYEKKTHLETKMEAYSNDVYEKVPFTLDAATAKLPEQDIKNKIHSGVYARFKPSCRAGCGYSCSMVEFVRETPTTGFVVLMHYFGIGD